MKFDAADPAGECVWANPSPPWWFGLEWSQFIQIFYHTCWRVFISWLLWHHLRFIMKRGHAQHRTCLSFVSFSTGPLLLCRNGSRLDVVEYGCCSALHWLKHTACGMSQAYNRCSLYRMNWDYMGKQEVGRWGVQAGGYRSGFRQSFHVER